MYGSVNQQQLEQSKSFATLFVQYYPAYHAAHLQDLCLQWDEFTLSVSAAHLTKRFL
jgi:hypothetical protein